MKSPLADTLNLKLSGVPPHVRLASLIVLARELEALRHALGYAGGGSWQAWRDEVQAGERPRWEDFTKTNAGITETTQRNYFQCGQVVHARLRSCGNAEALALFEARPSDLLKEHRQILVDCIVRLALKEGETFSILRRKYREERIGQVPLKEPLKRESSPLDIVYQSEEIKRTALAAGVAPQTAGRCANMILLRNWSAADIPRPSSPSQNLPGLTQDQIARAIGMSVAEVARMERIAQLAKRRQTPQ